MSQIELDISLEQQAVDLTLKCPKLYELILSLLKDRKNKQQELWEGYNEKYLDIEKKYDKVIKEKVTEAIEKRKKPPMDALIVCNCDSDKFHLRRISGEIVIICSDCDYQFKKIKCYKEK